MKKVLFVTYGGGHARMLKPVIYELEKYNIEITILALNTAKLEFSDTNHKIVGFKNFFGNSERVIKYGSELSESLDKIIDKDETICYLGQNFLELVNEHGESQAQKLYKDGGRYIFKPRKTMEKIILELAPDIVVTTNSPRAERYAVIAARKLGIKSVAFIDMFGIRCQSWFKENDFADKVFVLSESVKKYLVSLGRTGADVFVTGNPSFDILVNRYNADNEVIQAKRRISNFTVVWASQPEPSFLPETGEVGNPELPIENFGLPVDTE